MLDFGSALTVITEKPEYAEAIRCMVDLSLSNPKENFWVIVPGKFVSEGKHKNLTTEEWFEPSIIGTVYGDNIPNEWLLSGALHTDQASDEDVLATFEFITERNLKLLEDK